MVQKECSHHMGARCWDGSGVDVEDVRMWLGRRVWRNGKGRKKGEEAGDRGWQSD